MLKGILQDRLFIVLCFILAVLGFSYSLTFTFDSGHYMFLSDAIAQNNWAEWDPIRGITFPLFLLLFNAFLGRNQNALLLPMVAAQSILFLFSTYFVLKETKTFDDHRKAVILMVFFLMMVDPLIMGYYHVVLTEFFAATIAVISCFFAYKLYEFSVSLPVVPRHLLFCYIYFVLMIPVAWHLKQPYVGTALFPFWISCLLIIVRNFSKGVVWRVAFANIFVMAVLGLSILAWSTFLHVSGMPEKPDRELTGFINQFYKPQAGKFFGSPSGFIKSFVKNYLALSNVFYYDMEKETVVRQLSFTRANENQAIAYRMYNSYQGPNAFYMSKALWSHIKEFSSSYYPPVWLNNLLKAQITKSNLSFSFTYLLLPVILLLVAIQSIKQKAIVSPIILICGGSSLMSITAHALFIVFPLDRYAFWGYPLNLIVFIILLIKLIQALFELAKTRRKDTTVLIAGK